MVDPVLERSYRVLQSAVGRARTSLADAIDPEGDPQQALDDILDVLFDEALDAVADFSQRLAPAKDDSFLLQDFIELHRAVRGARMVLTWHFGPLHAIERDTCLDLLLVALDNERIEAAGNFEPILIVH